MDVATKLLAMEWLHFHVVSLAWVRAPWLSCASPTPRRVCVHGSPQRKEDAREAAESVVLYQRKELRGGRKVFGSISHTRK